jgi:DNA-binding LytR/AlgR family response regulator
MPTPIRILIVEDDPVFGRLLVEQLLDLEYEPLGPATSIAEARALFRRETPDLLLLDIHLPGESGIDLARQLTEERPTPLIFLTSADDSGTFEEAKAVGPAAYLTKPCDERSLQRAVELALLHFVQTPNADEPVLAWNSDLLMQTCLFVKERGRLVKVNYDDILWIEAEDRYCLLVTPNRRYSLRIALRELATDLPVNRFVQTHRSYLVNAAHIVAIDSGDGLLIVGPNQAELPLGRVYRDALVRRLHQVG